jgi:hypothetical protein
MCPIPDWRDLAAKSRVSGAIPLPALARERHVYACGRAYVRTYHPDFCRSLAPIRLTVLL